MITSTNTDESRLERFDPSHFSPAVAQALRSVLQDSSYEKVRRLPSSKGGSWLLEPLRLKQALTEGTNCWGDSPICTLHRDRFVRANGEALLVLFDLLFLTKEIPYSRLSAAFSDEVRDLLLEATVLGAEDGHLQSRVKCYPLNQKFFMFDPNRRHDDFVYFGWDSHFMVEVAEAYFRGRRFGRALDLCTGSGVQGLSNATRSEEVVCADINPRAIEFVRSNALLNGLENVKAICSDLFAEIPGTFDCITANTPYVPEPTGGHLPIRGGDLGIEFTLRLLSELPKRLTDKGIALIYTSNPIVKGHRVLLDEARRVLDGCPMKTTLVPIKRINYPLTPMHQAHYDRLGMSGYDDCILILERSDRWDISNKPWRFLYYQASRLDAWFHWKRRHGKVG